MQIQWFGLVSLLGTGCYSTWESKDLDGDGVSGITDCWESAEDPVPPEGAMEYDTPIRASDIFVGAEDRPYDGIDQNCDGLDDFDQDGDGFVPNAYVGIATLGLSSTGGLAGGDCDDEDAVRHPDTEELCDGVINGCDAALPEVELDGDGDGFVVCTVVDSGWVGDAAVQGGDDCDDEDALLFPTQVWYGDGDSDGFGNLEDTQASCTQPSGYVLDSTDCDDQDATVFPEAIELCDGLVNACGTELDGDEIDDDGDGYVECNIDVDGWDGDSNVIGGLDCSDADGSVHVSQTYYADKDGDGYGDPNIPSTACEQPTEYVLSNTDCDDDDATVYLNAPELCDGQSNACALTIPSDETDFDGDGYVECTFDGGGWDGDSNVIGGEDCDDTDANEFPGQWWFADLDGDGHGNFQAATMSCQQPSQTSLESDDCDDTDGTVYPGAAELCDGQVNNCGNSMLVGEVDSDSDGYVVCTLDAGGWDGLGSIVSGDDCDDTNGFTYPGAGENEASGGSLECMKDADEDGYGDVSVSGGVFAGTDCDDVDATIYPNASEICDGLVNACGGSLPGNEVDDDGDGFVECVFDSTGWDGDATVVGGDDCDDGDSDEFPTQTWYQDGDSDGIGGDIAMSSCTQPGGFVTSTGDCDDADPMTYPNASEICDGVVNACGGSLPGNEVDDDGDGFVECVFDSTGWNGSATVDGGGDCIDSDEFTYPGAASAESATLCMRDVDMDGFGDDNNGFGFVPGHDCDDGDETVYQGAPELCDGQLNACYAGGVPLVELDTDLDGYVACTVDDGGWDGTFAIDGGDDCEPTISNIHPYAAENADAIDHNCDGLETSRGLVSCNGGMGTFNGQQKYFLYCGNLRNPTQASFICRDSMYDDLASVGSAQELLYISSLGTEEYLIGYQRANNQSPWVWRDGNPSTYEFSSFSQPTAGTNVVVQFNGSSGNVSQWLAVESSYDARFVCSKTF